MTDTMISQFAALRREVDILCKILAIKWVLGLNRAGLGMEREMAWFVAGGLTRTLS